MFACLGHDPVGGTDDQDPDVHFGRTRDHVFDLVRVARAVDVREVVRGSLLFDSSRLDRYPPRLLFRRVIDVRLGPLFVVSIHFGRY